MEPSYLPGEVISRMCKMTGFVIVNFLSSQSPYETFDVREDKILQRKTSIFEKILRVLSVASYVPTTYSLIKYFLRVQR